MCQTGEQIQKVIDDLRRIYQAINEHCRNAERETELTGPQLWAMQLLANVDQMRVSGLAREMYLHPPTVVGILDRLQSKGLVTRTRSTKDRRAVELALTGKGQETVAQAPQAVQVMLLKGLEALPEEDFAVVVEGMQQIVRILGAEGYIPQPLHG